MAKRALWAGAGAIVFGSWIALARGLPPGGTLVPCPVRALTGVPCPGCGMTRALLALGRGDVGEALALHPLSPLIAAEAMLAWILWGLVVFGWTPPPGRRALNVMLAANAVLLFTVWVVRWWAGTLPW